jgi:N-acetylmuramoyl-L-alanine amidase
MILQGQLVGAWAGAWRRVALVAAPLLLVLGLVVWPPLPGSAATRGPAQVESMRLGHEQAKGVSRSRLVLQLNQNMPFTWFTLPTPSRVVLDLPDVSFVQPPNLLKIPTGSLIQGVRAGVFRPGTVRVVMDLPKPQRVSVFMIPANASQGPRLVVDVLSLKAGQRATNVPPPPNLVTTSAFSIEKHRAVLAQQGLPNDAAAPVPNEPVGTSQDDPVTEPDAVVARAPRRVQNEGRQVVVTLDAGHGGVDPGGCGRVLKLCEKGLTLDMAKRVGRMLEQEGVKVRYTRDTDVFVPLPERVRIAQRAEADLFVSLHADIHPTKPNVRGATVYMVSDKASDREAARLADKENDGDVLAGVALDRESPEVQKILISLVQRETINGAAYLGQSILGSMDDVAVVRKRELLFAGFRVLKAPEIPSVLVEMGYLSNPQDERDLANDAYRARLARSIAAGISRYIRTHIHY